MRGIKTGGRRRGKSYLSSKMKEEKTKVMGKGEVHIRMD